MTAITNFALKGRGRVYFDGRELGNISAAELGFAVTEQTLKDYRSCAGGNYASSIDIDEANVALTLHDLSPGNVAMAFYGTKSAIAAGAVTDESIAAPADLASGADRFVKTANAIDLGTAPVVTSDPAGTTYVADTDYIARSGGILILGSGSISASDPLLIDYTKIAAQKIEALMSASLSGELIIDGLNCVNLGSAVRVVVWNFKPSPAEAFALISEEFASFTLNGKADADPSQSPDSEYYEMIVATDDGV